LIPISTRLSFRWTIPLIIIHYFLIVTIRARLEAEWWRQQKEEEERIRRDPQVNIFYTSTGNACNQNVSRIHNSK
jgi:hypothetical protein